MELKASDNGLNIISRFCSNGREVVNLIQLCSGIAINEERNYITEEDIKWVIENGQYTEVEEKKYQKTYSRSCKWVSCVWCQFRYSYGN